MRKNWMLGFLGFLFLLGVPGLLHHEWTGVWLVWAVWFMYFIPERYLRRRWIAMLVVLVVLAAIAIGLAVRSDDTAAKEVQRIIAEEYHVSVPDVTVQVTKHVGMYMAGNVFFSTHGRLPEPGEGGGFLAIQQDGAWRVVYSGNGSIDCDLMKNTYRFPADVLTGFCD
jgi:hypothetical protein